ncbi:MAG TPA: hypothetical protein VJ306_20190, partial [Pyrinomonadaceae bacterium]|nr:hypothetical protein [Pyrinomonadaceae bacterium]
NNGFTGNWQPELPPLSEQESRKLVEPSHSPYSIVLVCDPLRISAISALPIVFNAQIAEIRRVPREILRNEAGTIY